MTLPEPVLRRALWAGSRLLMRPTLSPRVPIAVQRRLVDRLSGSGGRMPGGISSTRDSVGGVPAVRFEGGRDGTGHSIIYMHGGAYIAGSAWSHRVGAARLAASATVWSLDYRLAPEHPFPSAVDDVMAAYRALVEEGPVALAGDSAGAALAVAAALRSRDDGLAAPAALGLICPWMDLTLSGESIERNARSEPILSRAWLAQGAACYLDGERPDDPLASPLVADLEGLPPTMIQAAGMDVLLSDAERFAERAKRAGMDVIFQRYDGVWHDFQFLAGTLPTAGRAIAELARFLTRQFERV